MPTCVSDQRPAIVQGDRTVLLEVDHPGYDAARKQLARFAELEKSPEHVHTYRVGDLSLWNAAAAGLTAALALTACSGGQASALPVQHDAGPSADQEVGNSGRSGRGQPPPERKYRAQLTCYRLNGMTKRRIIRFSNPPPPRARPVRPVWASTSFVWIFPRDDHPG